MTPKINTSGITPIGDHSVVRVHKVEEKTAGGIILPENYKDKKDMAQLKATYLEKGEIGEAKLDVWPEPGDTVLITKYAGLFYEGADGEEYRIVNHDDIVGILTHD